MTTPQLAHTFCFFALVVLLFQTALCCGAPWGHLTWGGKFPGRLPSRMRAVALFSAMVLAVFAVIVEVRAGVFAREWQPLSRYLIWIVVGYSGVGAILNAITPSRWERIVWLPVVLLLLGTSLLIAIA